MFRQFLQPEDEMHGGGAGGTTEEGTACPGGIGHEPFDLRLHPGPRAQGSGSQEHGRLCSAELHCLYQINVCEPV